MSSVNGQRSTYYRVLSQRSTIDPIGHRSKEFEAITADITEKLQWLHQTKNDVLMLTSSGTGAMEAGIINFLSPGDRVLVGCNGKFGDRWAYDSWFGKKTNNK